jgi:hypothetical protein
LPHLLDADRNVHAKLTGPEAATALRRLLILRVGLFASRCGNGSTAQLAIAFPCPNLARPPAVGETLRHSPTRLIFGRRSLRAREHGSLLRAGSQCDNLPCWAIPAPMSFLTTAWCCSSGQRRSRRRGRLTQPSNVSLQSLAIASPDAAGLCCRKSNQHYAGILGIHPPTPRPRPVEEGWGRKRGTEGVAT